jgi:hypothetical protein
MSFRLPVTIIGPALALGVSFAGCGRATSPTSTMAPRSVVAGTVSDTSGAAIAGASVTLRDSHAVPAPRAGRGAGPLALQHDVLVLTTDANGRYAFEPVFAGDYVVTGSADGYQSNLVPVTVVTTGEPNTVDTTTVDIPLTPL